MRVQHELGRNHALKPEFHLHRRIAGRKPCAIANAKDVRIHRHGVFTKRHIEHDIGGLAAGAGQRLQFRASARHFATKFGDQFFRQRDDVPGLVAIEPDGLDVIADLVLARAPAFFAACRRLETARAWPC